MQKFTLEIETGNAAFDDEPASEIARILRVVVALLEDHGAPAPEQGWFLRDLNGNHCGHAGTVER